MFLKQPKKAFLSHLIILILCSAQSACDLSQLDVTIKKVGGDTGSGDSGTGKNCGDMVSGAKTFQNFYNSASVPYDQTCGNAQAQLVEECNDGVLSNYLNAILASGKSTDCVVLDNPNSPVVVTGDTIANQWFNLPITSQTASFRLSFDVKASASNIDLVVGLADQSVTSYSHMAPIVRLASNGNIDARNGSSYSADAGMVYVGGTTYNIQMEVHLGAGLNIYSVFAKSNDAANYVKISDGYSFRSENADVSSLYNLGAYTSIGSAQLSNVAVESIAQPEVIVDQPPAVEPPIVEPPVVGPPVVPPVTNSGNCSQAIRHGITWKFNGTYTCGTYANGDNWVVGPVTITSISSASGDTSGSMLNPGITRTQGFDSRFSATYNPYNAALNVAKNLPLTVASNSSLVSSISASAYQKWGLIQSFSVLTVVSSAPQSGSFRPGYTGSGSRASKWTVNDLDFSRLKKLPSAGLSVPSISTYENDFEKTWFEMDLTWTGRYMHAPYQATNGYGKDMAIKTGDVALMLNLDFTDAQKMKLLIEFVQYGIDIARIRELGGRWYDTGGHNPGRLAPLVIAAAVLNDAGLKSLMNANGAGFSETLQTFYVSQTDVNQSHYTADGRPRLPYTSADIGMPEWGETHSDNPTRDGNNWNASYRDICGGQMTAPTMAARCVGMRSSINHEALFDYAERHLNYEQSGSYGGEFNYNPTPAFHKQFYNKFKGACP